MKAVKKQKEVLLTAGYNKARLDFAETHKYCTLNDWKRVIYSDETKINILSSNGLKLICKKKGEGLTPRTVLGTLKFDGGRLVIWGCLFLEGPQHAYKIDRRMDGDMYR